MLKFQRGETVYYKEIPNDMYSWQPNNNASMKLICKHTHNGFRKGEVYEGVYVQNAIMIIREKENKYTEHLYGLKIAPGFDFIGTWFWTVEEWRELQLKEIGI